IEIYQESKQRYGAPKIHHLLVMEGYQVSLKRVQRLMKKAYIKSITVKKFRPTPSKEKVVERENIRSEERRVGKECKSQRGRGHTRSKRDWSSDVCSSDLIEIYQESKQRYGAPKIHHLLVMEGYQVSLKRVQRLMKKAYIKSITVKKFRPTPSKEKVVERENI